MSTRLPIGPVYLAAITLCLIPLFLLRRDLDLGFTVLEAGEWGWGITAGALCAIGAGLRRNWKLALGGLIFLAVCLHLGDYSLPLSDRPTGYLALLAGQIAGLAAALFGIARILGLGSAARKTKGDPPL